MDAADHSNAMLHVIWPWSGLPNLIRLSCRTSHFVTICSNKRLTGIMTPLPTVKSSTNIRRLSQLFCCMWCGLLVQRSATNGIIQNFQLTLGCCRTEKWQSHPPSANHGSPLKDCWHRWCSELPPAQDEESSKTATCQTLGRESRATHQKLMHMHNSCCSCDTYLVFSPHTVASMASHHAHSTCIITTHTYNSTFDSWQNYARSPLLHASAALGVV